MNAADTAPAPDTIALQPANTDSQSDPDRTIKTQSSDQNPNLVRVLNDEETYISQVQIVTANPTIGLRALPCLQDEWNPARGGEQAHDAGQNTAG